MTATVGFTVAFTDVDRGEIEAIVDVALSKRLGTSGGATSEADRLASWRERLWTCAPDTRLFVDEVGAALGISKRSVYRWVKEKGLPCRRRDDELIFVAGDVRRWADEQEAVVNPAVRLRKVG